MTNRGIHKDIYGGWILTWIGGRTDRREWAALWIVGSVEGWVMATWVTGLT